MRFRCRLSLALACTALAGCGQGCDTASGKTASVSEPQPSAVAPAATGRCPRFAQPRQYGRIEAPDIVETSGLVASRKNTGVLWLHNDSGNDEQLYAVTAAGKALATYSLGGATCIDWEDLALGAGPDGRWFLYVGDTGTNRAPRNPITVYRLEEPVVKIDQPPVEATVDDVETLELRYPEGPGHDSETLLIDPPTGDLYLISKTTSGRSGVYRARAPLSAGAPRTLEQIATLRTTVDAGRGSERITAGDISPDGRFVLVKTYTHAYLWTRPEGATIEQTFATEPCEVPLAVEPQGEAIGFAADGMGYFTVSEGKMQPVYFFERKD